MMILYQICLADAKASEPAKDGYRSTGSESEVWPVPGFDLGMRMWYNGVMNKDLKDKTPAELVRIVTGLGQKTYLAKYIFSFIHIKNAAAVSEITPLSKAFRAQLAEQGYFVSQLKTVEHLADPDGSTKFLFELSDGERVESVLLFVSRRPRYESRVTSHERRSFTRHERRVTSDGLSRDTSDESRATKRTLCVSTQVGCAMGCAFCATGRIKLRRSLTAGEIADQVNQVEAAGGKINNVVYMGMGEPLENYDAVLKSVRILNHTSGKNIGIRHITISTCGIARAIRKLAGEEIRPRLAISLNAPSDALRGRLMPINRTCPLADLLKAVRLYQDQTQQRVTFEYVLFEKLNDSAGHAKLLIKLLQGISCNVNLIEYNPWSVARDPSLVSRGTGHEARATDLAGSSRDRIAQFATVLKEAGLETVTRFKLGRNIKAACGQLQAGYNESS